MSFFDALSQQEITILKMFNQPFSVYFNLVFMVLIYLIYPMLIVFTFYYIKKRQNTKFFHLVLSAILGYLFVLGIKYYFDRPRPYETYTNLPKIFEKSDPSFPSAHTFMSFLMLSFIPAETPKWLKYILAVYLSILVPFSVMYAGVHYPSDVIAGAILGILFPKIISEKLSKKIFKH